MKHQNILLIKCHSFHYFDFFRIFFLLEIFLTFASAGTLTCSCSSSSFSMSISSSLSSESYMRTSFFFQTPTPCFSRLACNFASFFFWMYALTLGFEMRSTWVMSSFSVDYFFCPFAASMRFLKNLS